MARSIPSIITTVTFAALAITACTLSIVYAGVLVKNLVSCLTGAALLLSLMSGFSSSFDGGRDDLVAYELELNTTLKRAAFTVAAVLLGMAAFRLCMFATTNALAESTITIAAAALSLVAGFTAGFLAGYELEAPNQHQHARRCG